MPNRQLDEQFTFTLFDKAAQVREQDWQALAHGSIFLELAYLTIAERCEHTQLGCRYVVVYNNQKPCGIIYYQIADFKAGVVGDLFGQKEAESVRSTRLNIFEKYIDSNKEEVLLRLFTCGNNLVSGDYGYRFDKSLNAAEAQELLLKITDVVAKEEKLRGTISAILIKDFYEPLQPEALFKQQKYSPFLVEPNLIVEIPNGVQSLNDYLELFSKKYRHRAKSIFKSMQGIEVRYMELAEITAHESELYALYEEVFEKAKFKLMKLPRDYFSSVKSHYKELFTVKGFFMENKLVAFASNFLMPDGSVEAHYIGVNYGLNHQYNLYQNILYAMLQEAIVHQRHSVNLGRTAAEIKTTVGAKAKDLLCYIKPQNTISKLIQKPFIAFLQPPEWIPRNPFKEEALTAHE